MYINVTDNYINFNTIFSNDFFRIYLLADIPVLPGQIKNSHKMHENCFLNACTNFE